MVFQEIVDVNIINGLVPEPFSVMDEVWVSDQSSVTVAV